MQRALFCLLLGFLNLAAQAKEPLFLKVKINQLEIADAFLLTENNNFWIAKENISYQDIPGLETHSVLNFEGLDYIDFSCQQESISCQIDEQTATLLVTLPGDYFPKQQATPYLYQQDVIEPASDTSAFLNYSLQYRNNGADNYSFSLPLELGIHANGWSFLSAHHYQKNKIDSNNYRLSTQLVRDFPNDMTRLIIGDFTATSGLLGGGGSYGGISYSRNFTLQPFYNQLQGFDLTGVVEFPSQVEVLVDGQRVFQGELQPGQFDLNNISAGQGAANVELIIRDPFGREQILNSDVYVPRRLLRQGISEFSYSYGLRRTNMMEQGFDYEDWAFVGFHRWGLNSWLTSGFYAEADDKVKNYGVESSVRLWQLGEINLNYSSSRDRLNNDEPGHGWLAAYHYNNKGFNLSALFREESEDYMSLNRTTGNQVKRQQQYAIGYFFERLGSFNLRYRNFERYQQETTKGWELNYNKSLGHGLSFNAFARRDETAGQESDTYGIRFYWSFGNAHSAQYSYNHSENNQQHLLNLQRSARGFSDHGYRVQLARNESDIGRSSYQGFVDYEYKGQWANYRAEYNHQDNADDNYSLQMSGALSLIEGYFGLSQPIYDSFALVEVGVAGVDVLSNNTLIGATGESGKLIAPNLASYYGGKLSIDANDVPVEYQLEKTEQKVATLYRSGVTIPLQAKKQFVYWGQINIVENGETKAAQYKGLRITTKDKNFEFTLSKEGEFYFDSIEPGEYQIEIFDSRLLCTLDIKLDEAIDGYQDLGVLICEN